MADFLIHATISNLVVSSILAIIAWFVQRRIRSAGLANLLWAIVLVKMVTPPLFSVPIIQVPSVSMAEKQTVSQKMPRSALSIDANFNDAAIALAPSLAANVSSSPTAFNGFLSFISRPAIFTWLAVSTILFVNSTIRIQRFHRLLKATCHLQTELTGSLGADVANRMGLRKTPNILATSANVAPFVWWMAGRSVIVLSDKAIQKLNDEDLCFVVTHEMAHIKRRDHWFRWLEWLTLIGLWWNPTMWWARAQLRITEEMACDDLVLETTAETFEVHQYANSLLNVAELLVTPAIRPPVVASAINSGGCLEKRLKMIMTEKIWKVSTNLRMAIVAIAACAFPLGIVAAQDFEAVEKRLGGSVEAGELTLEQASVMMDALRRSSANSREMKAKERRFMEFEREIFAAIEAGKMSEEDGEKKLIAVRREMFEQHAEHGSEHEIELKKRRYQELEREIKAAVEAGKLSEEDAERKLLAVRREMFEERAEHDDEQTREAKKRRYRDLVDQIEAALEAGKMSEEDAEKKLVTLRKKMSSQDKADGETDPRMGRFKAMQRKIGTAVREKKLTEEQAEKKLIALRKEIFSADTAQTRGDGEKDAKMERYQEFERSIKSDVRKGELKPKQAEKKLIEMRWKIFGDDKS